MVSLFEHGCPPASRTPGVELEQDLAAAPRALDEERARDVAAASGVQRAVNGFSMLSERTFRPSCRSSE
jgi:hypothetical protein